MFSPSKTPGQSLMSVSDKATFLTCCHSSLLEELNAVCETPLKEGSRRLTPGFLVLFPFADFALYHCPVINHTVNMTIF